MKSAYFIVIFSLLLGCGPAPVTPSNTDTTIPPVPTQISVFDINSQFLGTNQFQNGPDYVTSLQRGQFADLNVNGYSPDNYPCFPNQAYNECEMQVSKFGFIDSQCLRPTLNEQAIPPITNSIIFVAESSSYFLYVPIDTPAVYSQVEIYFLNSSGVCTDSGGAVFALPPSYFTNITATVLQAPLAKPLSFSQGTN